MSAATPAPGSSAGAFFAAHYITIQRVLTDNAMAYRHSAQFQAVVAELGAVQRFCRPYRPQTNGKVERFNRTLLTEWAYARLYLTNTSLQPSPRSYRARRPPHPSAASTTPRTPTPGRYRWNIDPRRRRALRLLPVPTRRPVSADLEVDSAHAASAEEAARGLRVRHLGSKI